MIRSYDINTDYIIKYIVSIMKKTPKTLSILKDKFKDH